MDPELTLLHTDLVDSTALNARVGDVAMAALWNTHDRDSRDLLRRWRGREIDRSDGFMVLFDATTDAAGFAADYHRMLAALPTPMQARAGIHIGALQLRENNVADIALGAKPLEVLGIAKALSARLMALAQGGQTLASPGAAAALQGGAWRCQSHGHWRMKGIDAPLEVFEVGDDSAAFVPPPDSQKAQRVVLIGGEWVGAQQVPHNLPAERDSWVGRAADLQALAQQLHDGARLVTLHGTGGMGKTRLALRYAWAWLGEHPGGVWFCDLSQARGLDGLLQAVAQGLDVPLGNDPAAQLGRAIAGRGRCLVILDNFEQIARHARDSVGRWLDAAPAAHFIVTSREVLGLVGERMFSVSPLGSDDAVALFQQRARAADRNYDPAGADPATLQSLVELLDYLPLAIELAAPRVRVMPVAELLARMGDRFRLLAGARGRPERQATLHGALQWSWELLDGAEQAALAQVSVFEGGFTLAAAEAVVDLSGCDPAPWLVDVLQSLIDRSLLRRSEVGRFGLLRSVQEFAASKLHATWSSRSLQAAGTSAAALQRHCTYFAQLEEAEAAAQRSVELDNIIAACRVAGRSNDPSCATACLVLAWSALRLSGPMATALDLADMVRLLPGLEPAQFAAVQWVTGAAAFATGQHGDAQAALLQGVAALPLDADRLLAARLHCSLGDVAVAVGDGARAVELLARAQSLAESAGHGQTLCRVLNALGLLAASLGHADQAMRHYEAASQVATESNDMRWLGGVLGNLGALHVAEGRLEQAMAAYQRALALAQGCGDRRWEGNAHCNLGLIHHELGQAEEAEAELVQGLALARSTGYRQLEYTVLCNLGLVLDKSGRSAAAIEHLQAAAAGAHDLGNARAEAQFLCCLGGALSRAARHTDAMVCLHKAIAMSAGAQDDLNRGLAQCNLADAARRAGELDAADAARRAAVSILRKNAWSEHSELGRRIAQTPAIGG